MVSVSQLTTCEDKTMASTIAPRAFYAQMPLPDFQSLGGRLERTARVLFNAKEQRTAKDARKYSFSCLLAALAPFAPLRLRRKAVARPAQVAISQAIAAWMLAVGAALQAQDL